VTTINRQVAASLDDACVYDSDDDVNPPWDAFYSNALHDYAGKDGSNYREGCGMRFTNITIPQGAIIDSAYLTFTCRLAGSGTTVRTNIIGEDVDDAAQFSNLANYNGRSRTSAIVAWDGINAWVVNSEYVSPDIKTVIKEIIDRAGWASGNDLVLFWENDLSNTGADRIAWSYDGSSAKAPKLAITYHVGVAYTITVTEVLGMSESVGTKAAFKKTVSESLGMSESVAKPMHMYKTVSEILGMRDQVEIRKHKIPIGDLPDHVITGGAKHE